MWQNFRDENPLNIIGLNLVTCQDLINNKNMSYFFQNIISVDKSKHMKNGYNSKMNHKMITKYLISMNLE